jgi:nucleoside-diphosphate-sugar epimerase
MMNTLIIGGANFIGPYVVQQLVSAGHEVTVFHRGNSHNDLFPNVRHLHADRAALPDFAQEFRRLRLDTVIDMYLMNQPDAIALMRSFRGVASSLVVLSSQDVYRTHGRLTGREPGPPELFPLTEDSPLREQHYPYRQAHKAEDPLYNYDKIPVEQCVMGDPELRTTVLRLPMVYGPLDYNHRLFEHLKRMDDGRPYIILREGHYNWRWTHGYVENVAAAITLAATDIRAKNRIYNVGEADAFTRAEWVRRIGTVAGWTGEIISAPLDLLPEPPGMNYDWRNHLVADTSRIRQELGYAEIVDLGQGMEKTIEWERANPPDTIDPTIFDYAAEDEIRRELLGSAAVS